MLPVTEHMLHDAECMPVPAQRVLQVELRFFHDKLRKVLEERDNVLIDPSNVPNVDGIALQKRTPASCTPFNDECLQGVSSRP